MSRTSSTFRNIRVRTCFILIELVIKFFSRKIFINYLGAEIIGLNTTAFNLLEFLNLAELGVGSAVAFSLYKPALNGDTESINEIITFQSLIYRKIALAIIFGAVILMGFFPLIFEKMQLPLWYAYAVFAVFLFNSLLSYFFNYKQVIHSVHLQEYKIDFSITTINIIKLIIQAIAVYYLPEPYIWWLILELIFGILASYSLHRVTKKSHPYLKSVKKNLDELRSKYADMETRIRQLFFHKIGTFALGQTTSLIIFAFISLGEVTVYGNYLIVTNSLSRIFNTAHNGIFPGIGNLVAEGNRDKIISVFHEIFVLRITIAVIVTFIFHTLVQHFIINWIGAEYILDDVSVLLISILLFIQLQRMAVDCFINAYGLFSDIWAPAVEAVVNISASIIGGFIWGINGILAGCLAGTFFIILLWKPYYLFHRGLNVTVTNYYASWGKNLFAAFLSICTALYLIHLCSIDPDISWLSFSTYSLYATVCILGSTVLAFYIISHSFRKALRRLC